MKIQTIFERKWKGGKMHEVKGDSSKESTIICYECKKSGHIKVECLLFKKREKKDKWKRAMAIMTWSDDGEFDSKEKVEPKKVANLCLMAHEEDNGIHR